MPAIGSKTTDLDDKDVVAMLISAAYCHWFGKVCRMVVGEAQSAMLARTIRPVLSCYTDRAWQ
jgi:hypothetical protein